MKGLTLPAGLAGVRVESVTATATGGADGVRLDGVRVRVPKAAVLAEAKARLPKAFPVADQLLAANVVELAVTTAFQSAAILVLGKLGGADYPGGLAGP